MHHNSKSIFWFRRDLRLDDNHGLYTALKESKKVYCVFVFDSNILSRLKDKDDKRVNFIWESVLELKTELRKFNHDLFVLFGDPQKVIPKISEIFEVDSVYTNRDYESYSLSRDEIVHARLSEQNRHFITTKDHIVHESTEVTKPDGSPYTVFTPYKKTWLKVLDKNISIALKKFNSKELLIESQIPNLGELENLYSSLRNANIRSIEKIDDINFVKSSLMVHPGSLGANSCLESFLKNKVLEYKQNRDFPFKNSTSNLSVHLRFGTISIRECFRRAIKLLTNETNPNVQEEINTWISELIWREFYSMVLQAFPHVEEKPFRLEYENLVWRVDDKLLSAWEHGLTGYPIVDAGMRQLRTTGQMHNRLRMITASFLTKDLLIDWRKGEAHFARYLLDFELASNNGGWQWSSSTGTDAAPYFRIFNPQLQGEKFDPNAEYIKQYVPELRMLDAKKIHKLDFELDDYPRPIVRREETKKAVLDLFNTVKSKTNRPKK
ncbi:MAG: deoxyribodipyrimidine photo-lyase [Candidatus Caenarcaniphilales bacterium]|nr:deoxyribodipyrimidine photo-lyase [Candidatus Caenarcaniphilales bacterium]